MSRFSIVIPAFNSADYLDACFSSISGQDFEDWEIVVVVDGSPDNSAAIARCYAEKDPRIRVVEKERNEGIHLARVTGVENAKGDYVFFLDADDELHEGCLGKMASLVDEDDADIIHLGINVIGVGIPEGERSAFESYINRPLEPVEGSDVCAAAYSANRGFAQDWRLTQRLYRSSLIKEAASLWVRERLGRNEDGYEYFVTSCLASREVTRNDIVALDYYYGRGLNSSELLPADKFVATVEEFNACLGAIDDFSSSFTGFDTSEEAAGCREKAVELLFNDWKNRLSPKDKLAVAPRAAKVLGTTSVASEMMRLVRDDAYAALVNNEGLAGCSEAEAWFRLADSLCDNRDEKRFQDFRRSAFDHLSALEKDAAPMVVSAESVHPVRAYDYDQQRIRIFVTTHKLVDLFGGSVLQPVQVGPLEGRRRFPWALQDDAGENVASLNPMFCELTTQYWAWKNVDADYYGFCHYRRYFDFSDERHQENEWGEIMDSFIDGSTRDRYCLDDAAITKAVEGYDVITTEFKDIREFPDKAQTPFDQYRNARALHISDLDRMMTILKDDHPDYAQDADEFLSGHVSCFCNMFIMRADLFRSYCAWLFPMLERFVAETDFSLYSVEAVRTPGHLAERLLNIFLIHERRVNPSLREKQLQCVHFERPERQLPLRPMNMDGAFNKKLLVPVVFAADDAYVPMVTTTIASMLRNASADRWYDICVLTSDISADHKASMRAFFEGTFPNVRIGFHDVSRVVKSYGLQTSNEHISVETYYRFLIQKEMPFYDKVLYLDSDLIIQGDVAELFDTELGNNLLGAVRDVDYLGNLNMHDGKRLEYTNHVLKMSNPYDYFQAGVLVLNTKAMREFCSTEQWLEYASAPDFIYDDQDVLNAHCEGHVTYLDQRWNVMHDCGDRVASVFSSAPAAVYKRYLASRGHELVIHYAGFEKPWNTVGCDRGEVYWSYARETPFYEELLALFAGGQGGARGRLKKPVPPKVLSPKSPIRKVVDPLMPLGSRRREVVKAIGRKVRGLE